MEQTNASRSEDEMNVDYSSVDACHWTVNTTSPPTQQWTGNSNPPPPSPFAGSVTQAPEHWNVNSDMHLMPNQWNNNPSQWNFHANPVSSEWNADIKPPLPDYLTANSFPPGVRIIAPDIGKQESLVSPRAEEDRKKLKLVGITCPSCYVMLPDAESLSEHVTSYHQQQQQPAATGVISYDPLPAVKSEPLDLDVPEPPDFGEPDSSDNETPEYSISANQVYMDHADAEDEQILLTNDDLVSNPSQNGGTVSQQTVRKKSKSVSRKSMKNKNCSRNKSATERPLQDSLKRTSAKNGESSQEKRVSKTSREKRLRKRKGAVLVSEEGVSVTSREERLLKRKAAMLASKELPSAKKAKKSQRSTGGIDSTSNRTYDDSMQPVIATKVKAKRQKLTNGQRKALRNLAQRRRYRERKELSKVANEENADQSTAAVLNDSVEEASEVTDRTKGGSGTDRSEDAEAENLVRDEGNVTGSGQEQLDGNVNVENPASEFTDRPLIATTVELNVKNSKENLVENIDTAVKPKGRILTKTERIAIRKQSLQRYSEHSRNFSSNDNLVRKIDTTVKPKRKKLMKCEEPLRKRKAAMLASEELSSAKKAKKSQHGTGGIDSTSTSSGTSDDSVQPVIATTVELSVKNSNGEPERRKVTKHERIALGKLTLQRSGERIINERSKVVNEENADQSTAASLNDEVEEAGQVTDRTKGGSGTDRSEDAQAENPVRDKGNVTGSGQEQLDGNVNVQVGEDEKHAAQPGEETHGDAGKKDVQGEENAQSERNCIDDEGYTAGFDNDDDDTDENSPFDNTQGDTNNDNIAGDIADHSNKGDNNSPVKVEAEHDFEKATRNTVTGAKPVSVALDDLSETRGLDASTPKPESDASCLENFTCVVCNIILHSKLEYENHLSSHINPVEEENILVCRLCPERRATKKALQLHMKEKHKGQLKKKKRPKFAYRNIRERYWCQECGRVLRSCDGIRLHKERHKLKNATSESIPESEDAVNCVSELRGNVLEQVTDVKHHAESQPQETAADERDKAYPCEKCGKVLGNLGAYTDHMGVHERKDTGSSIRRFECERCGKVLSCSGSFKYHMEAHKRKDTGTPRVSEEAICPTCNRVFKTMQGLKIHMEVHTGSVYACSECNKQFSSPLFLKNHVERHIKLMNCEECGLTFRDAIALGYHALTHKTHDEFVTKVDVRFRVVTGEKAYACSKCPRQYSSFTSLKIHWLDHTERVKQKFCCPTCGSAYTAKCGLRYHMERCRLVKEEMLKRAEESESMSYKCQICSQVYSEKESLRVHLEEDHTKGNNSSPPVIMCEVCGLSLRSAILDLHQRRDHDGTDIGKDYEHVKFVGEPAPYGCVDCDKCCNSLKRLEKHYASWHCEEEAPVEVNCELCGDVFGRRSELTRHLWVKHSVGQPLAEHSFVQPSMKRINRPRPKRSFQCDVCAKILHSSKHFKAHLRIHTGETPYKCKLCPKAFRSSGSLYTHMVTHDPVKAKLRSEKLRRMYQLKKERLAVA